MMERKNTTVTKEELIQAGCIFIPCLSEGLSHYDHCFLEGTEEELWQQLQRRLLTNGTDCTYFDFYYGQLTREEKAHAHAALTKEQIICLEELNLQENQIYFRYSKKLFEIAFCLSAADMLFSTFYFAREPETVWGNYDRKFISFTEQTTTHKNHN